VSMNVEGFAGSNTLGFGYAQNISESGLSVDAQALEDRRPLPGVGSKIRMRFKIPNADVVVTAQGKVVRVDLGATSPLFALEFVEMEPDFREAIRRYVEGVSKIR